MSGCIKQLIRVTPTNLANTFVNDTYCSAVPGRRGKYTLLCARRTSYTSTHTLDTPTPCSLLVRVRLLSLRQRAPSLCAAGTMAVHLPGLRPPGLGVGLG